MKIDFYRHQLTDAHAEAMARVLNTPILTTGTVNRQVEARLCEYFGLAHAVLVNSWTNGAFAALLAMGIGPGDEVIVPANTFIATANAVELTGAKVVFVDAEPDTLLITPELVASVVTSRTRAVVPVHLYGQMCDVANLRSMLDNHPNASGRITILEDAAHCFEGERGGYKPGRHSDLAVFSFYATKNVTCGEGGAIVTGDPQLAQRLLETRLHGMSAIGADRFSGGRYNHWDMMRLGTKANLPDLLAVLLPAQIDAIDAQLSGRQAVADRYRKAFAGGPLRLVRQLAECKSAEHIFPIGVPGGRRDEAIAALNTTGVPVTVNYRSVPGTTYYRQRYGDLSGSFPVAHRWGRETLTLPLYPSLSVSEQDYIIRAVKTHVYPLPDR
jgi:UDP-4-amino-4-deoxy-L-arabinose-oxoglutarate aminotransferase